MEKDKTRNEKALQGNGYRDVKIEREFDAKKVDAIAKASGAESVRNAANYLRVPYIGGGRGFRCEIIDDVGFFAGNVCKKHFRLYEMAVKKDSQSKGYGTLMIMRMKRICKENGLEKITCRTSKKEKAIDFYRKHGGKIVGEKGGDYEVEIIV